MAIVDRESFLILARGGPVAPGHPGGIFLWGNAPIGDFKGPGFLSVLLRPTIPFSVDRPRMIQAQPRQRENEDFRWPDQFSVMVNDTAKDYVRVLVSRMDGPTPGGGWGQDLMLDFFIVDDGTEPEFP